MAVLAEVRCTMRRRDQEVPPHAREKRGRRRNSRAHCIARRPARFRRVCGASFRAVMRRVSHTVRHRSTAHARSRHGDEDVIDGGRCNAARDGTKKIFATAKNCCQGDARDTSRRVTRGLDRRRTTSGDRRDGVHFAAGRRTNSTSYVSPIIAWK